MTERTHVPMDEVPASAQPPRLMVLAAALLGVIAVALSVYLGYRQMKSDREQRQLVSSVATNTSIRCEAQRLRLEIPPETGMERALKKLALDEYQRDCVTAERR